MIVTSRFAALVFAVTVLVGVGVRSWGALLAVDGALLALAVLDVALAGAVRPLQLSRTGATSTRLGEPVTVTLTVRNAGRRTVRGQVRDAWVPSAGARLTRHRLDVAADRITRIDTHLVPSRRGERRPDRVTVRSLGPLRLVGRQGSHRVPWAVRVLPAFPSRKHLPSRLARLRELDGRTAVMVRGQGTEFDSLREYVAGDDVRSIDWRATARTADVMVRTWRPERDRRVVIVVDCGRTSAGRIGDGTRLDAAMDAAQLLAALASRAGDRVDLLAYDRAVRADVRGSGGANLLARIAGALTYVEPELVETDAVGLVGAVQARVRQRALVVLLTPLEPAAMTEGLLPVLPALTTRHLVVLASVQDPRLQQMARARGDAAAVYDRAAGSAALAARERTAAQLTALGVELVDAGPDQLGPDLADRYLALKASGRL
ncbi:MAG: DUF58 domain-containing protein [Candidatus Nanopelagicales bacterium]